MICDIVQEGRIDRAIGTTPMLPEVHDSYLFPALCSKVDKSDMDPGTPL
jgi:hypothetical protein